MLSCVPCNSASKASRLSLVPESEKREGDEIVSKGERYQQIMWRENCEQAVQIVVVWCVLWRGLARRIWEQHTEWRGLLSCEKD